LRSFDRVEGAQRMGGLELEEDSGLTAKGKETRKIPKQAFYFSQRSGARKGQGPP